MNCFIGHNGEGKTNLLDAVYYLSFCHSAFTSIDSQVICHDQEFFVLEGEYADFTVSCGMKRGVKKHFKRDKKEYKRLSQHIGQVPLVFVSPSDQWLIEGGSEERRKLMDMVISQYDNSYIDALNRYSKALQQRNNLLKMEDMQLLSLDMDYLIINFIGLYKTLGVLIGVIMAFLKWKLDNLAEFLFLSLILNLLKLTLLKLMFLYNQLI
jgi:DNA replication and repair protein RecF